MMRTIAAILIAGASAALLGACSSTVAGKPAGVGSNTSVSANEADGSVQPPVVGNEDTNGETINLDNASSDTLLTQMYKLMGGGCAMSVRTYEENVACADKTIGTVVTMHGTVTEKLGLPEDNYIMVSVGRDGRTGTFDVVCQDDLAPCMSVEAGDSVYVVATLQDIKQNGESTLYTLGPGPRIQSITKQ